jgi:hypothetical protein
MLILIVQSLAKTGRFVSEKSTEVRSKADSLTRNCNQPRVMQATGHLGHLAKLLVLDVLPAFARRLS